MYTVYECYDRDGDVLYVGVTSQLARRFTGHKKDSPWYQQVAAIETRQYDTADDAALDESTTIQRLLPVYNRDITGKPSEVWASKQNREPSTGPFWQLQEIAKAKRWSARALARETGLAYNTVWGIWANKSKRADLETMQRLADALGVYPGELIGSDTPATTKEAQ